MTVSEELTFIANANTTQQVLSDAEMSHGISAKIIMY